jgi:hypothetical protein
MPVSNYLTTATFNVHSTLLHTSATIMIGGGGYSDLTSRGQGIGFRLPPEAGDSSQICRPALGLAQPHAQRIIPRAPSPGVKWPGRGSGHLPPPTIKVKNTSNYASMPLCVFWARA